MHTHAHTHARAGARAHRHRHKHRLMHTETQRPLKSILLINSHSLLVCLSPRLCLSLPQTHISNLPLPLPYPPTDAHFQTLSQLALSLSLYLSLSLSLLLSDAHFQADEPVFDGADEAFLRVGVTRRDVSDDEHQIERQTLFLCVCIGVFLCVCIGVFVCVYWCVFVCVYWCVGG